MDYFSNFFKSSTVANGLTERERVKVLTEEQNSKLGEPILSEEVRAVFFSMHLEKSPGVDGLNPAFSQTYWRIVGLDVTTFIQNFFNTGKLMVGVNRTLVYLIPKVKEPKRMTDLRPISLYNVLMRILSNVMANRLRGCLSDLICNQQSTFVEG